MSDFLISKVSNVNKFWSILIIKKVTVPFTFNYILIITKLPLKFAKKNHLSWLLPSLFIHVRKGFVSSVCRLACFGFVLFIWSLRCIFAAGRLRPC